MAKLNADSITQMFEHIKGELAEIKQQTTKTNGRVTELEAGSNRLKGSLMIFSAVVLPILLYILYLHIKP